MGLLRDVIDTVKSMNVVGTAEDYFKTKKYSSISKRSTEGTLQFPVLVSRSMDIDTLQIITKALERQYSTFTQIVLTMNPILNIDTDLDAAGYLRKFHQNTDVKTDSNDIINSAMDIKLIENYTCFASNDTNTLVYAITCEGSTGNVVKINKEQLMSILDHVVVESVNSKFIPRNNIYKFNDPNLSAYYNAITTEAADNEWDDYEFQYRKKHDKSLARTGSYQFKTKTDLEIDKMDLTTKQHEIDNANTDRKFNYDVQRDKASNDSNDAQFKSKMNLEREKLEHQKENDKIKNKPKLKDLDVKMNEKVLLDNDVKKSNELVATTLHLRVRVIDNEGNDHSFQDFIIGVKATMHPINSDEMVTNLINGCNNNNKFFDFIKWTTGETEFFKDFLFNVKEIKDDVVNNSQGASPWWIILKRKRLMAKVKDRLFLPNKILPNTTIVVSAQEVEFIKSHYGFDLMSPVFINKIMDTYFLLGFVVVDNSTQIAHFLFDGQKNYQSMTFSGLERENSAKVDTKEILKLMNKM